MPNRAATVRSRRDQAAPNAPVQMRTGVVSEGAESASKMAAIAGPSAGPREAFGSSGPGEAAAAGGGGGGAGSVSVGAVWAVWAVCAGPVALAPPRHSDE